MKALPNIGFLQGGTGQSVWSSISLTAEGPWITLK